AGWEFMVTMAEKSREDPRPLVPIPIRWDGDAWVDWLPERSHPLSSRFYDLARRYFLEQYSDQKQLVDRLHEQRGIDIFVASYKLVEKTDKSLYSYAVWGDGVKSLLPQTEWVMFAREDGLAAVAHWESVQQLVGRLMQSTENYPARFLVEDFPNDAELKTLGKAEP